MCFVMPAEGGEARRLTVPFGRRVPVQLHRGRTSGRLRRRARGHGGQSTLSDRVAAGALSGAGRRRPADPTAHHARRGRALQRRRSLAGLSRPEGRREPVAQASDVGDRARHLGDGHARRHASQGHDASPARIARRSSPTTIAPSSTSPRRAAASTSTSGTSTARARSSSRASAACPVRFLSMANDGTLAFGHDGQLYTMRTGAQPQRVAVTLRVRSQGERHARVVRGDRRCERTRRRAEREGSRVRLPRRRVRHVGRGRRAPSGSRPPPEAEDGLSLLARRQGASPTRRSAMGAGPSTKCAARATPSRTSTRPPWCARRRSS